MLITGVIRATRGGFAFLIPDEGGEDLLVRDDDLAGAIHGDRVRAHVSPGGGFDYRPSARVEEIIERTHPAFTGDVSRRGRSYVVRPDSPLLPERLSLRPGGRALADGEKVLFEVRTTHDRHPKPYAVYRDTLGEEGDARLDPVVIASEFNLALRFSDRAMREAEDMARRETLPEDVDREDFRNDFVLTIDPVDAKDYDDAISVTRTRNGGYVLTVHIADVTAYVEEGGALDREAQERGTSVYFPGSVIPMLPEILSSDLASLGPDEDKRTMVARMEISPSFEVVDTHLTRGWMRSGARLHYAQALDIVEGRADAPDDVRRLLGEAAELARGLRARRFRSGGFELEVPETEMKLRADGVPSRLRRREPLDSHHWIEEFMIAANRATGRFALEREWPYLFRVHEPPSAEAVEQFIVTVLTLRPGVPPSDLGELPRLRRWLAELPASPLTAVIHRAFLRSMKKAVYAADDQGHFGLGIEAYCHFTSPIRRYPDLYNHRRIKQLIDGAKPVQAPPWPGDLAAATSRLEQNAEAAEREMIRLKQARYAAEHLGREGKAVVTAVTPRGLFVELAKVPLEGFVPAAGLDRSLRFDDEALTWYEPRAGWNIRPGDAVIVQMVHADLRLRRLEFRLIAAKGRPRRSAPRASRIDRAPERRWVARRTRGSTVSPGSGTIAAERLGRARLAAPIRGFGLGIAARPAGSRWRGTSRGTAGLEDGPPPRPTEAALTHDPRIFPRQPPADLCRLRVFFDFRWVLPGNFV